MSADLILNYLKMNIYFNRAMHASCSAMERGAYFSPSITIYEIAQRDMLCLSDEEVFSTHDGITDEDDTEIW